MAERYRSMFSKAQLIAANKPIVVGEWVRLGAYDVKAGENYSLGFGGLSGMDNAVGRIFMQFKDSNAGGTEVHGMIRLMIYSPQNRPIKIMHEFHTAILNQSQTDRTKQMPFPEGVELITEDKKIVLEFCPDSVGNGTLSLANSTILMDVTAGVA